MADKQTYYVTSPDFETDPTNSCVPTKVVHRKEITTYEYEDATQGELISKVDILTQEVEDLIELFKDLSGRLEAAGVFKQELGGPKLIIVEEMDKITAKQMVIDFMKEHDTSDIEELHQNIRCEITMLIDIVDELLAEGVILE